MTDLRELLLLRHGKSDWSADTGRDFDRPLAARGRKSVTRMGRHLCARHWLPDAVISSPAVRAEQTALLLCEAADIDSSTIVWDVTVYEAGIGALLDVLARVPPAAQRVLVVGHNPGLELLLRYLANPPVPADGKLVPTAALARLAMPADWRELTSDSAQLLDLVRPRELDD